MEILDEHNRKSETISDFAKGEIKSSVTWMLIVGVVNIALIAINIYFYFVQGSGVLSILVLLLWLSANVILIISGDSFRRFSNFGNLSDLEDALEKQKQYWQFMSFFVIIILVIVVYAMLRLTF